MDMKLPTIVNAEDWDNLCVLCSDPEHLQTLYNHLESLITEWNQVFGWLYPGDVVDVLARVTIRTGLLRVNKESYTPGIVIKCYVRDPERLYCALTRFIMAYMDSNLNVISVSKSTIEPRMEQECYHHGAAKK